MEYETHWVGNDELAGLLNKLSKDGWTFDTPTASRLRQRGDLYAADLWLIVARRETTK